VVDAVDILQEWKEGGRGQTRGEGQGGAGVTRAFSAAAADAGGRRERRGEVAYPGLLASVAAFLAAGGGTAFGGIRGWRVFHLGHGARGAWNKCSTRRLIR
jgi:hypothetical protein